MKKVLSLVLAVVLVLGMSAISFAKINENNHKLADLRLGYSGDINGDSHWVNNETRPDDEVKLYIYDNLKKTYIFKEDVRDLDLGVQVRATEGSNVLDSAKIDYETVEITNTNGQTAKFQRAFVKVSFVETFVSTKEQDYDILLHLTSEKKRINRETEDARLSGTFENFYIEVDEYDDYVYLYDTPVAKAQDYIRNIKVDLGQGIAINAKMFEDKNYYGKVSQDVKEADEAIIAKYPDIDTIYYLQTIGLSSTGDVVEFYDLGDNFYVYVQNEDGNLVYIGRTNDKLPYFTKYFLAAKELEVDAELEVPEGGEVEPEEGPNAGGNDAPANINDNPSTGR